MIRILECIMDFSLCFYVLLKQKIELEEHYLKEKRYRAFLKLCCFEKERSEGARRIWNGMMTKLANNENVTFEIIAKIYKALNCKIDDILEIIPDDLDNEI